MVIPTRQDYLAPKEYYRDQMRHADKHRLVQEALAGRPHSGRFYSSTLTWLGQRLVSWGRTLQEQCDTPSPANQTANRAAS